MEKKTTKILEELRLCKDFNRFYSENQEYMIQKDLSALLNDIVKSKKLMKSEIIRNSELSEIYGYQIFSGARVPERGKLLCLILGMRINIKEAQLLLKTAGYSPLYAKLPADSIVLYGICKKLTVIQVNELLFEHGFEMI